MYNIINWLLLKLLPFHPNLHQQQQKKSMPSLKQHSSVNITHLQSWQSAEKSHNFRGLVFSCSCTWSLTDMGCLRPRLIGIPILDGEKITDYWYGIVNFWAGLKIDLFWVDCALNLHWYDNTKILRGLFSLLNDFSKEYYIFNLTCWCFFLF